MPRVALHALHHRGTRLEGIGAGGMSSLVSSAQSANVVMRRTARRRAPAAIDRTVFEGFAKGSETGDWLAALDDFRNWLIREAA